MCCVLEPAAVWSHVLCSPTDTHTFIFSVVLIRASVSSHMEPVAKGTMHICHSAPKLWWTKERNHVAELASKVKGLHVFFRSTLEWMAETQSRKPGCREALTRWGTSERLQPHRAPISVSGTSECYAVSFDFLFLICLIGCISAWICKATMAAFSPCDFSLATRIRCGHFLF